MSLFKKKSINFLSQQVAFGILLYFERVQDCNFLSKMCGYHNIEFMEDQSRMTDGGVWP